MRFSDFKIKSRIYAGFAAVIVVAAASATIGYLQLSTIDRDIAKFVSVSGNTSRNLRVQTVAEQMRGLALNYRFSQDEASAKAFAEKQQSAVALLDAAGKATISQERRTLYAHATATIDEARTAFDKLVELGSKTAAARARLFTGGDALTAATSKLVLAARAQSDTGVRVQAAEFERAALLVRVANWRFLATLDPKGPATFKTNFEAAQALLEALEKTDAAAPLRARARRPRARLEPPSSARRWHRCGPG
jgi:hypothetical protein